MTNDPQSVLYIGLGFGLAVVLFYVVQVGKRMRQNLAARLKRTAVSMIVFVITAAICDKQGMELIPKVVLAFTFGLLAGRYIQLPRRSRYIPVHIKRAVLERDSEAMENYDSRRHHLDHIVPLAKGGDTSVANLRVLSKEKNLRKGAKMPRLKDFL